jgi:transaldolase
MSRIRQLNDIGVSVWLDDLSRALLEDGVLQRYVAEHRLSGVTSNPTIFAAALAADDRYDDQLDELLAGGLRDPQALFFALALRDVGGAADLLRGTYDRTDARDGYVSFEWTPDVAHDTRATVRQALDVWDRVDAPNLMVKVPATDAGIDAIEELTFSGVNVNVTLLFSATRYEQGARACQRGIARRAAGGQPVDRVRSVAASASRTCRRRCTSSPATCSPARRSGSRRARWSTRCSPARRSPGCFRRSTGMGAC